MRLQKTLQRFGNQFKTKRRNRAGQKESRRLQLELLETRLAPSVSILNGGGSGYVGNDTSNPPDVTGAAGPNSYIEVNNSTITIFSPKATRTILAQHSIFDFFYNPAIGNETRIGCGTCDSTGIFDNLMGGDGRFIIGDIDVDGTTNVSQFVFAVSTSSNPTTFTTADWNFYHVTTTEGTGGSTSWGDYPGNPGFNADAFVDTFNTIGLGGNDTEIVSVNASDLANGVSQASLHFYQNFIKDGSNNYRPTAMHDSAPGDPMWLIRNPGDGTHINVTRMDNVLSSSATFTTTPLTLPAADTWNSAGFNDPLNPDSTPMSDIGLAVLKAGEFNNTIVATHKIAVGTASIVSASVKLDSMGNPIGGSGYTVGDTLTLTGGTFTTPATLTVDSVDANGGVLIVTVANPGNYSSLANVKGSVTGGTGSGAKFRLTFSGELDVQWYAIDVSGTPTFQLVGGVPNVGRIGFGPNTYSVDPAIDINAAGQIGLCFMESDTIGGAANSATGGFISTFVAAWQPGDAAGTMETPILVPAGTGTGKIFGRIGDFSGMSYDPANGTFWGVNEFGSVASGSGLTDIANFAPGPQAFIQNGVLVVTYMNPGDLITLRLNPGNSSQYQVFGGFDLGDFDIGSFSSVNVQLGGGSETVNIENTLSGVPVTVNEGSGSDTVGISRSGALLDNIQGDVFINSGTGVNTLNVYDQNDTIGDTWTITGSTITRTGSAVIHYNGQSVIVINGGSGNLTYNVSSTEASFSTSIDTGPGSDTVNVQSTAAFSTLTINNLFSTSNHDTVNIGSKAPSLSSTLANIAGTVNVANSSGGGTTLTLDDSGDTTGQTFAVTSGSITGTAFSGAINYNGNNGGHEVTAIHLLGGGGGNTFNVQSTAPGTPISINTDALIASTNNHVNIGSTAPTLGGTLANIAGPVNVSSSSGSTTLTLDDSGDTTAKSVTFTNNSVSGTWSPAAINYANVSTLNIDGGTGINNTYNVQSTASGTTTNLLLHGANTVKVGSMAPSLGGTLANIAGPLNVSNSSVMVVDDSGDSIAQTATITNNSIVGLSPAAISYTNVGSLHIHGGTGGDTFNVLSTASGTTTDIVGHGSSTVNVGNAGSVQGILGALNIENPPSFNTIFVDDSADAKARTVTLSSGGNSFNDSEGSGDPYGFITGLAPAAISYEYFDTTSVTINGGSGTGLHTYNVLATGVTTTINGGAGNDTFNVGNAGILDAIVGALTVNGNLGTNTLNVDDHLNGVGQSFTLSSTVLTRSGGVSITYGTIKTLNIKAGSGDDAFLVSAAPTTTTNLDLGGGNNTLTGPNASNTWTITGTNKGTLGKIAFTNVQNLVGGTGNDTYKFSGLSPSLSGTITDSGGANKLDYSLYSGGPISVNLQTSAISLVNGGAPGGFIGTFSSLVGSPNAADTLTATNNPNNWSITGPNAGKVNTFTYTGIENLIGGSHVDVFKFSAAGTELSIDGGTGGDWLDYSGFASAVAVNLATGSATNVNLGLAGSIHNIQNVHGGNAGNTLTGDAQGNILIGGLGGGAITGGTGRSILIADKGSASVTGGSSAGGDILIGDYTTFDTMTSANEAALASILAEWQSADSYADRFGDINKGTAYGFGSHLNGTNVLKWGTTVKDNGLPDAPVTVTAALSGSALDWFFVDTNDLKVNFEPGEHVNNT